MSRGAVGWGACGCGARERGGRTAARPCAASSGPWGGVRVDAARPCAARSGPWVRERDRRAQGVDARRASAARDRRRAIGTLEARMRPREAARGGRLGRTPCAAGAASEGTMTRRKRMPETAATPAGERGPKRSRASRRMSAQSSRSGAGTSASESKRASSVLVAAARSASRCLSSRPPTTTAAPRSPLPPGSRAGSTSRWHKASSSAAASPGAEVSPCGRSAASQMARTAGPSVVHR